MNQNKNSSSLILVHHGILGQKWGVRRYQNPDGSLTEAGRKRLLKNSGYYLNPKYDSKSKSYKNGEERARVANEYVKEFDDYRKKVDIHSPSDQEMEYMDNMWMSYLDKYSEATIKDLKMNVTPQAKEFVEQYFKETDDTIAEIKERRNINKIESIKR